MGGAIRTGSRPLQGKALATQPKAPIEARSQDLMLSLQLRRDQFFVGTQVCCR
jgi:hypothetical protein